MKKVEQSKSSDTPGRPTQQPRELTAEELEAEFIFPLKQKSTRFADAIAFCQVCEYHIHSSDHARQHFRHPDHQNAKKERARIERIGRLPEPNATHSLALSKLIEEVSTTYGRPVDHLLAITHMAEVLAIELQTDIHPECQVRVYGSCQTGVALRSSNVNFELVYPEKFVTHSAALTKAHKFLASSEDYTSVNANFQSLWPSVYFCARLLSDVGSPLCVLSVRNTQAYEIGDLLRIYVDSRPQLAVLAQALRHWARVCKLDDFTSGGLPPYAFDLMLVHFLQQIDYLPVLHEIHKSENDPSSPDSSDCPYERDSAAIQRAFEGKENDWNLGKLWVRFFKYYTVLRDNQESVVQIRRRAPVDRDEKNWTKKRIAIEDPFLPQKNLAQFSPAMYDYFVNCLQTTFVYFSIPRTRDGAIVQFDAGACPTQQPATPVIVPTRTRLLNGLRPQPKAKQTQWVASQSRVSPPKEQSVDQKPPSVETQSPNLETVASYEYDSAFLKMIASTALANCRLPLEIETQCRRAEIFVPNPDCVEDCAAPAVAFAAQPPCSYADDKEIEVVVKVTATASAQEVHVEEEHGDEEKGADVIELEEDEEPETARRAAQLNHVLADSPEPEASQPPADVDIVHVLIEKVAAMSIADFLYDFSEHCFCGNATVEVTCSFCTALGHKEEGCPEKNLPPAYPLPPMTQVFHDDTAAMLDIIFQTNAITSYQLDFMERLRSHLHSKLAAANVGSFCRLDLFGSARNGFGFCFSDIDLCLRFKEDHLPQEIIAINVIQKCAEVLKKDNEFTEVTSITSAKVPIVKFKHKLQCVEGDISLYNVLALRNTELLNVYSTMDERVRRLGITIKTWASKCMIGDASRGSLSSYSWIIMLLHYLQRCDPPVVPVLQEMGNEDGSKTVMVDGWNTYFYSDMSVLSTWSRNRQTVAQLWLGFLCYYAETFNAGLHVVQIRQSQPLSKFEKLWTGKSLAIEDPFDLNHNLVSGLGKRMFAYVWRCIIHGRWIFGNSAFHDEFLERWHVPVLSVTDYGMLPDYTRYMLDQCQLPDEPPRDRVCRICSFVGHFAESCPRNRRNKMAAAKQYKEQQNQSVDENGRRPSTSSSDRHSAGPSRTSRPPLVVTNKSLRAIVGRVQRQDGELASGSWGEERRSSKTSTASDKSDSRKERRLLKKDAQKMLQESLAKDGDVDDELMANVLGDGFVNAVDSFPPVGQPLPQMPSMRRGGGRNPGDSQVYARRPRGFDQRAPRVCVQQFQHMPGSFSKTAVLSVAQLSSATISSAIHPPVISSPPGASKQSRSGKRSAHVAPKSKRNTIANSAAAASDTVRLQPKQQLAAGPPGSRVKVRGLGRGHVTDIWTDD